MTSSYNQTKRYPEAHCTSDIPMQISSQQLTRPHVSTTVDHRSAIANNSQILSGGSAFIFLPLTPNAFIKSGSSFLNFNLQVVVNTLANAGGAAVTGYFSFAGPTKSAHMLISRMQLNAGASLENLQYYNIFSEMMLLNSTNQNFLSSDAAALMNTGQTYPVVVASGAAAGTQTFNLNISIPVLLGSLSSNDSHWPLCLMTSSPQIMIDFASALNQVFQCDVNIAALSIASYSISNLQLCYTNIQVDPAYVSELKMLMKEKNFVYNFSAQNLLGNAVGDNATIRTEFGLLCSSLCGVHWTNYSTPTGYTGSQGFRSDAQTIGQLYCDNRSTIVSQPQDMTARAPYVYAINKSSWSTIWDPTVSYGIIPTDSTNPVSLVVANQSNSLYATKYFTCSAPLQAFNEIGLCFSGSEVNRAQIEIQKSVAGGSSALYLLFVRDCVYSINYDGQIDVHF